MNLMAENFLITPCMLNVAIFFLPVPPAWFFVWFDSLRPLNNLSVMWDGSSWV